MSPVHEWYLCKVPLMLPTVPSNGSFSSACRKTFNWIQGFWMLPFPFPPKAKLQIFIFLLKRQLPCRAFLKGKQFPSLLQSITSICITCLSRNSPPTSAVWPNRPTARKTLVGSNCWAHHDIIIIKIIIVINTTRKKHFFKLLRSLNLPQLQRSSSS